MQVGSLVECTYEFNQQPNPNERVPQVGNIYVVRAIENGVSNRKNMYIRVEEIVNPPRTDGEIHFSIECFREVQPPMTITIEELLSEPVTA